jgi:RNA polymerase sigma factor (sigma-70 family)
LELAATLIQDPTIEGCKQGDALSYKTLYNQYAKAMYNTALRIVDNSADAEDILQESFVDAFRFLENFQNRSTFGAWLKRIVVNKSINKVKRNRHFIVDIEQTNAWIAPDEELLDEAAYAFRIEEVKKAIQQLPDGYRTILCLHLMEDYKHDEIAVMLGISSSTVRTQYIRAKAKLLNTLKEQGL